MTDALLQWIIGVLAGSGVIVFVAKFATQHLFSRDLERFKAELKREHSLELQRHRAELAAAQYEHETRFGWLHEKRAKVIAELYKRLARTELNFRTATNLINVSNLIEIQPGAFHQKLLNDAANEVAKLDNYFSENRLFLSEELTLEIERVLDRMKSIQSYFVAHPPDARKWEDPDWREKAAESWAEASEVASEKVPELLKRVEQLMRHLLEGGDDDA